MTSPDSKKLVDINQLKYTEIKHSQNETESAQTFIDDHISLVHAISSNIANKGKLPPGVEEPDLVNWGIEGLYKAKKKFAEKKGSKFTTYAYYRIRGEILDRVREEWQYRTPNAYQENRDKFQNKLADILETALESGESVDPKFINKHVHELISNSSVSYLLSIEALQEGFEPASAGSDDSEDIENKVENMWTAVKKLSEDEQLFVKYFYIDNLKQKEIAEKLRCSNSKISRIHLKILEKLKRYLTKSYS